MNYKYHHLLRPFTLSLLIFLVSACEDQNANVKHPTFSQKQYNHKGLKLVYPENWSLNEDRPGEIANRRVEVSMSNFSVITTLLFCKTNAFTSSEYADLFVNETTNNYYKKDEVRDIAGSIQRKKITLSGYEGFKLSWVDTGKGLKHKEAQADINVEVITLQLRSEPYPVFVQFEFFDDDIFNQQPHIIPFMKGVSFDPQEIEIWEPTFKL